MLRLRTALLLVCGAITGLSGFVTAAKAEACTNTNALGTSRTVTVDSNDLPRIGTMQYRRTLPLDDHEVVITFDDGPLPPYTNRVLDALATECVKVTYFLVGTMARANPDLVRRIYNAGHVIGTHSHRHPFNMDRMERGRVVSEIDSGIAAVTAALGDERALAPFFRVPGLARSQQIETYAASQSLSVWSADEVADDWHRGITAEQIVQRAMNRIEAKGHRGVLLLHDIHPATARAVPMLLKRLKAGGYRIVQAVPTGDRPASVPERSPVQVAAAEKQGWPRVVQPAQRAVGKIKVAAAKKDTALRAKLASRKTKTVVATSGFSTLFNR
ncbi:polysaccharide deacetylase family protein [Undibacter mobilis]|uniref:Chitooligosaccharide deacetylase n=1 Tax=Undibacter mobilis TaxID=2292256 RepID=A0A371BDJ9_9BRAD|nr:polysaccharide deacetylase family protein [Undibacter mobilis]RDV05473.1 polysaccharide deacetylase family protein [Undibacter mobilis]